MIDMITDIWFETKNNNVIHKTPHIFTFCYSTHSTGNHKGVIQPTFSQALTNIYQVAMLLNKQEPSHSKGTRISIRTELT